MRDVDDQIVTVGLEERTYLTRTVYLMDGETYKEQRAFLMNSKNQTKGQLRMQDNTVKMILLALRPQKMMVIMIKTIKTLNTKTEGHDEEEETDMMTLYSC